MNKVILYIHGKGGSHLEAEMYRKNCPGYEMIGIDYEDYRPWVVEKQIRTAYDRAVSQDIGGSRGGGVGHCKSSECGKSSKRGERRRVYVLANSIGAYFAMHTLQDCAVEKAFFISPVLDMEQLIFTMMGWAGVTEQELREKGQIVTGFGETLSYEYLTFVREHPIKWQVPTEILYAGGDNLISRDLVEDFVQTHDAGLTVMEDGEHWFHTQEQLKVLDEWMRAVMAEGGKETLLNHIDRLHTTEMGVGRIKRNLKLETDDVVSYCKSKILDSRCRIYRQGKNWYCEIDDVKITVNSYSYTIITAHILKR